MKRGGRDGESDWRAKESARENVRGSFEGRERRRGTRRQGKGRMGEEDEERTG